MGGSIAIPVMMLALHFAAAVICGLAAAFIWSGGRSDLPARAQTVVALLTMAIWCAFVAAIGPLASASLVAEAFRNIALVLLIHRLFDTQGQRLSLRPIVATLIGVELLQGVLAGLSLVDTGLVGGVAQVAVLLRLMVAVGALLLVHNLYIGTDQDSRTGMRPVAVGLAGFWTFELNFYLLSSLSGEPAVEVSVFRGLVTALCAIGLILGSRAGARPLQLRPSRGAAVQTISLAIIGIYVLAMIALSEVLSLIAGDAARMTQIGLLAAALVLGLLWLPSKRAHAWLRVVALKHFFQHRYDYREEWLRFTQTVGSQDTSKTTLNVRVLKAMADITDSPSARLYLPDEDGRLAVDSHIGQLIGSEGDEFLPAELSHAMEREGQIVDLDEVRQGRDHFGEGALVPDWIVRDERCWAIVPLMHFQRLVGAVILARPARHRALDWEDFDLLKLAGRQVASFLAEQAGHEKLMQAAQFDQFNRRIAFVMHDIKNLASQLNLLASNAERHADKPAFREDMLVTLRTSSAKLKKLLDRLGGHRSETDGALEPVQLGPLVKKLHDRFSPQHRIDVSAIADCTVQANREALSQALVHLLQNGIDATQGDMPVNLHVASDGLNGRIEIVDSGSGMTAEFLRNGLFRPFVSSKNGGFGIGAFEARELIQSMGGRIDVTSREGLGTRFVITLPLAAAAGLLNSNAGRDGRSDPPASEVA